MPTIKEIKTGKATILAVTELPEDTSSYMIISSGKENALFYDVVETMRFYTLLPTGQWSILGWSDELTEEQMEDICGEHNGLFEWPDFEFNSLCTLSLTQSFSSLLRSQGITNRALILKSEI